MNAGPDVTNLYRALRREEIEAGCILIPKSQKPFRANFRFPVKFPAEFGETVPHAIRDHQDHGKFPTRGISTTPFYQRALHYAQHQRRIARIDVTALSSRGVKCYRVADFVEPEFIAKPEDDEVILVYEDASDFPDGCIAEVFVV